MTLETAKCGLNKKKQQKLFFSPNIGTGRKAIVAGTRESVQESPKWQARDLCGALHHGV